MRSRKSSIPRRPSRTRARNSRRQGRPSLREAIHDANHRAKQRANRRMGRRLGLTSVQAAIADTMDDGIAHLGFPQRLLRWCIALALLPVCAITTMALFNVTDSYAGQTQSFWMDLIRTRHFLYFSIGMFLMSGWFFTGLIERFFLYLYVLGHELTHAIFVYLCGGKVSSMHITADGGYIMTNKSNVIIALSPYFIPFWSVVVLLVSTLLGSFYRIPYHEEALFCLIGATWAFHLLWTIWMIPRDQPDLEENGTFFSIVIIYLANVIVLSVLLCLAPGNLTWHHWANQFMDAAMVFKQFTIQLMQQFL
ncbi:hypothetical protein HW115_13770 [Verrucomicrobiaceae bacterium N1E253]|uniref:Uncharacterized protein n=1 Tax=Oceaniferula marina TaxID=2748318 RepID=A0A851GH48_9BACT|nr:hypothetical protein [Oceaniferula marina]NWK56686.1 hypothetical protein [Oceaniferula marina]